MDLLTVNRVYLIGIGGIGMSALARYFHAKGMLVSGYDKTSTTLTKSLAKQGMEINFEDDMSAVPLEFLDLSQRDETLIIYTPAIPKDSCQLSFFQENGYPVYKRARVLGEISKQYRSIAVGGSHGKTTISAMITEVFRKSEEGCSAFLGGISKNIDSNFLLHENSPWAVIEADEFDRSFLLLDPEMILISSMDSDHLDIYGDAGHLSKSFESFLDLLDENGTALLKEGLELNIPAQKNLNVKYYGLESGKDYFASNIRQEGLIYHFDLNTPIGIFRNFVTSVPGWINIENAVGAAAICFEAGLQENEIREGISNFKGIKRRFDVRVCKPEIVFIDDYAHHPKEIRAFLFSIRKLFPNKRITGVFQPHLFSRTRDFAKEFGHELSRLDELILLDIYPAREKPLPGVTSKLIMESVEIASKCMVARSELLECLKGRKLEVLVTMGAGDIDLLVGPLEEYLIEYGT